jgi:hypothetical protein
METNDIYATDVTVRLGQTCTVDVDVRGGLKARDRVIVSDASRLDDNADRIRLN